MIQLKSGTLLVIAATVVTAILILTTSRDTSSTKPEENVEVIDEQKESVVSEDVEVEDTQAKDKLTDNETNKVTDKVTDKVTTEVENKIEVEVEEDAAANTEKTTLITQTEAIEIKAPEGPYVETESDSSASPEKLQASDDAEKAVVENQTQDDQAIKAESINVVATSNQHDLLNHLIQPIWMDQKLGDFKSVEKGDVVFKMMPTTPEGLQGENPKNVVTNDSDKFAPTTVSADFNYQQMPMYNGGYYIAPMPPYLMESMLPVTNKNID